MTTPRSFWRMDPSRTWHILTRINGKGLCGAKDTFGAVVPIAGNRHARLSSDCAKCVRLDDELAALFAPKNGGASC